MVENLKSELSFKQWMEKKKPVVLYCFIDRCAVPVAINHSFSKCAAVLGPPAPRWMKEDGLGLSK